MVSDDLGGSLLAWWDYRGGSGLSNVVGQRLGPDGVAAWPVGGSGLTAPSNAQSNMRILVTGPGTALVVWDDFRAGGYRSIFAQGIGY